MKAARGGKGATRDEKAENLALNYPLIMMAAFGDVFSDMASAMTQAVVEGTEAVAQALTEALPGDPKPASGKKPKAGPKKDVGAEASEKTREAFAEMRGQLRSDFQKNKRAFAELIANPAFDEGIGIVESYDFKLPRLTESLSDGELGAYVALMKKGDPKFGEMLQKLSAWQEKVPRIKEE